jgi:hypothetical protein
LDEVPELVELDHDRPPARPPGSGLGQCRRAWSLTQRITLCAETPRRLPIAFMDRPVQ